MSTDPPRQRLTAGVLVRDQAGRVLLVEPTYRPDWLTPGGSVEATEATAAAAAREALEELDLPVAVGRLLAVQWSYAAGDTEGALQLAYDGGVLDAASTARIRLEDGLRSFRFVPVDEIATLASQETTERVVAACDALRRGTVVELGGEALF